MLVDIGAGSTHVVITHGKHMVFAKHVQIGGDLLNRKVAEVASVSLQEARDLRIRMTHEAASPRLPAGVVAIGTTDETHIRWASTTTATAKDTAILPAMEMETAMETGRPKRSMKRFRAHVQALDEPMEILVTELQLCVRITSRFFRAGRSIASIFVGGESRHVAICQTIAKRLGLPATLGDPLARLLKDETSKCGIDMRQPQPGWAVAVGLALGIGGEK